MCYDCCWQGGVVTCRHVYIWHPYHVRWESVAGSRRWQSPWLATRFVLHCFRSLLLMMVMMFDYFTIFCLQLLGIGHSQLTKVSYYILRTFFILLCSASVPKFDKLFSYCAACIACRHYSHVSQNQKQWNVIFVSAVFLFVTLCNWNAVISKFFSSFAVFIIITE